MVSVIRSVLLLALLLAGYPALAAFGIFQVNNNSAPASFTPAWQDLRVGAGGNMAGIVAYSDGTVAGRGDVLGNWIYKPGGGCTLGGTTLASNCWQNTTTGTALGSYLTQATAGGGNFGGASWALCPSNTQVGYTSLDGKLFGTTNQGGTYFPVGQTSQLITGIAANGAGASNLLEQIVCDPNNPDTAIVGAWNDHVYKVTNGRSGLSATVTALPTVAATGTKGAAIAFEQGSSTHIIVCVSGTGCYESTNGSTYVSIIAGGPTQVFQIYSDKFSQFWATVQGTSLHRYVNGSGWSTISAGVGPISVATDPASSTMVTQRVAVVTSEGQLVVSDDNGATWGALWNGGLTVWGTPAGQPGWVANANQESTPFLNTNQISIDPSGTVWLAAGIGFYNSTQQAGDPPWVSQNTTSSTAIGSPVLTFSGGVPASIRVGMRANDVTSFNIPNNTTVLSKTATTVTLSANAGPGAVSSGARVIFSSLPYWNFNSVDTNTMVVNFVQSQLGGSPITCQWDRGVSLISNPDVFATVQYPNRITPGFSNIYGSVGAIVGCWGISSAPNTVGAAIAYMTQAGQTSAFTLDGGNNWTVMPTLPTGTNFGGKVAAWSSTSWAMIPAQGLALVYLTTNAGGAWAAPAFTGGTPSNFVPNYTTDGLQPLAADQVNADTFYVVDSSANHQIFRSVSGGAFVKQGNVDTTSSQTNAQLKAAPGNAGHLFYTGGSIGTTTGGLFKSTVGGGSMVTCNANLKDVLAFGFGYPKPGAGGYPSIYAMGYLSTVFGLYASFDACATWTLLNIPATGTNLTYPMDVPYQVHSIDGDPNVYGRVNVATGGGSGATYIDTADACPWVNFTSIKPTDTVTGTINLVAKQSGRVPVISVNFYVDGALIGTQTSGTGTPTAYTQSWVTGGVAIGAHTLKVEALGNGCTAGGGGNSFSIPITTN